LSDTGSIERAISSRSFLTDPSGQPLWQRVLGPSSPGRFWSVEPNNYVVEEWGLDGVLVRSMHRNASWFQPAVASAEAAARIRTEAIRAVGPGHAGVAATARTAPVVPPRAITAIWSERPDQVWV